MAEMNMWRKMAFEAELVPSSKFFPPLLIMPHDEHLNRAHFHPDLSPAAKHVISLNKLLVLSAVPLRTSSLTLCPFKCFIEVPNSTGSSPVGRM